MQEWVEPRAFSKQHEKRHLGSSMDGMECRRIGYKETLVGACYLLGPYCLFDVAHI